jgi:hypothetical protein
MILGKCEGPSFTLELPLKTEIWQADTIDKRMEIGRHLYNSLLTMTQKRYKEMVKTKVYRGLYEELVEVNRKLSNDKDREKLIAERAVFIKQLNAMLVKFRLSKYDFHADIKEMCNVFSENIDSHTGQNIADRLWKAYKALIFGDGKELHYKKFGQLNSLEGKDNRQGIRYRTGMIKWNGLVLPVVIEHNNQYEKDAFDNEISYCRIIRRPVNGKIKHSVQIVFKGTAPVKKDEDGNPKHKLGEGDVGVDIGMKNVAVCSESEVRLDELADRVQKVEDEKRLIQRKLDRSRRANNPDNFNADGTIKCLGSKKRVWNNSNNYKKLQAELREIQRKQAAIRRYQHECLANHIVTLGDNIMVEKMSFKGLAKRTKQTKKNEKGKFKSKKRFGKSIGNKAPAMFLEILDRKLNRFGKTLHKVNAHKVKASQYHHVFDEYIKKKLSQRWNTIEGKQVHRDMYSAFLLMCVNKDLESINKRKCKQRYGDFLILHDAEVDRIFNKTA